MSYHIRSCYHILSCLHVVLDNTIRTFVPFIVFIESLYLFSSLKSVQISLSPIHQSTVSEKQLTDLAPVPVDEDESNEDTDDDEGQSEDARLQLMMMMLKDDDQKKKKRSPTISNLEGFEDFEDANVEAEEEKDRTQSDSIAVNPLVEEFDPSVDGDNRVLSRAIEGGVEKHILTLTANVSNILHVNYWRDNQQPATSVDEHLKCHRDSIQNGDRSINQGLQKQNVKRRVRPFLPFVNGYHLRTNVGCVQDADPPDPQLFSNLFIERLANDRTTAPSPLPWAAHGENEQPGELSSFQPIKESLFRQFLYFVQTSRVFLFMLMTMPTIGVGRMRSHYPKDVEWIIPSMTKQTAIIIAHILIIVMRVRSFWMSFLPLLLVMSIFLKTLWRKMEYRTAKQDGGKHDLGVIFQKMLLLIPPHHKFPIIGDGIRMIYSICSPSLIES